MSTTEARACNHLLTLSGSTKKGEKDISFNKEDESRCVHPQALLPTTFHSTSAHTLHAHRLQRSQVHHDHLYMLCCVQGCIGLKAISRRPQRRCRRWTKRPLRHVHVHVQIYMYIYMLYIYIVCKQSCLPKSFLSHEQLQLALIKRQYARMTTL